jgi:hypothetical protein
VTAVAGGGEGIEPFIPVTKEPVSLGRGNCGSGVVSKSLSPLTGDQGFESRPLQRRESAANLAPSIRCRWPPLPSHFSLLSPIAAPAPASAEAPIQAATMVTHCRKATIDGVSIFYREAGPADGPVFLLLHGFPTSSPTA